MMHEETAPHCCETVTALIDAHSIPEEAIPFPPPAADWGTATDWLIVEPDPT